MEIPFPDRFLLYEGGASQGPVMGRCRLTDEAGRTLCARFHRIDYSVFDDGYIGIAVCYGERAAYPCYDEAGHPMPEGYWLVDRDGIFAVSASRSSPPEAAMRRMRHQKTMSCVHSARTARNFWQGHLAGDCRCLVAPARAASTRSAI